jgi:hypothetical protein
MAMGRQLEMIAVAVDHILQSLLLQHLPLVPVEQAGNELARRARARSEEANQHQQQ